LICNNFAFSIIIFSQNFPLFHQRGIPKWGLFLVGSTISGFGSDTSDIDMCLVHKDNHFERVDPRMEAMVTLNDLKNFLQNSLSKFWKILPFALSANTSFSFNSLPGPFQSFSLINAKVPILRFRDATNKIEIDLNYNNCIGVRNTQLLNSYSQCKFTMKCQKSAQLLSNFLLSFYSGLASPPTGACRQALGALSQHQRCPQQHNLKL
jgi:hypothetical protein